MFEQDQNPFKRMQGDLKDVPQELRQKVMNDVAMAKLIMEMATLFTSNYGSLIESLLKTKKTK
ncbi:hypothetical protein DZC72_15575 [Maribacter algicola]|uniref:Uncharacterized protein n=1 Tax=Maribacter algicola TaxID=2498892 RepID=A0A426RFP4_9FLAO|nr:hypothetical protein [Maribacter algicola]RRQ47785.1 hypothetical protein DZC72_15575 [Maribacter algicola]